MYYITSMISCHTIPCHAMPCHVMPRDSMYLICICCTYNAICITLCYVGLPSELGPRRAAPWGGWCRRVQGPPSNWAEIRRPCPGSFASQDFGIVLRSLAADSSSLRISAILVGHFTSDNYSLSDSPQNFHTICAETYQHPGSQNSLTMHREFWRWKASNKRTINNLESTLDKSRTTTHPGCPSFVT